MSGLCPNVLIIEDNQDDIFFLKRHFNKINFDHQIYFVKTVELAFSFLQRKEKYEFCECLDQINLIILDLYLPGYQGIEILKKIRSNSEVKNVPVVIFSSFANQNDIDECYRTGANSYVEKPMNMSDYLSTVTKLIDYWTIMNLSNN